MECLRCHIPMSDCGYEKIQLGQTGWILGDLPNLVAGALEVHIYICPQCGKIEFFRTASSDTQDKNGLAQVKCPKCGILHDFDYPKCPNCKYNYYEE